MSFLTRKTVLLTGATGGIGSEVARQLSAAGARLILTGRSATKLKALQRQLAVETLVYCCDLMVTAEQQGLLQFCQQQGGIDILINNAGISQFGLCQQQQFSELISINLLVPMQLCQLFLPVLRQRKGQIVNVGSAFGSIGHPGFTGYCATKFGLRGFTEALQRELAGSGIQVKYFAPRATETSINSSDVMQLNEQLGNSVDSPVWVAEQLIKQLKSNELRRFLGWPERIFVRLNALFPALVDMALKSKLTLIELFAVGKNH
ncbi:short-subunit dehydrogenase [Rheinheimera pacifica]|uniref:SDR family oxidoreductase n=1 Tax=Rheinheimera pacifica TaxID=173990 RepID=UPI002166ECED|nr:SDR family oxidoreductase [Rheinheimera pacifica]MCS4307182.1 short-subunit dehydrogenase [Rheinheimera pacifica]